MPQDPILTGSAASLDHAALTALFSEAYHDYDTPLHVDAAALTFMMDCFDLDREASRVLRLGGTPAAFAMLGIRGAHGWIGGMGVPPEFRRRGLGEQVMRAVLEEAKRRGLTEVGLEVLVQNAPAIALYRRLGFETTRRVEVWVAPAEPLQAHQAVGGTRELDWREASAWIARQQTAPEPWQRQPRSLEHFAATPPGLHAIGAGHAGARTGACVCRVTAGRCSVLQFAVSGDAAAGTAGDLLAAAARGASTLRWLNVPEDEPVLDLVRAAGGTLEAAQWEMRLPLA